MKKLCRIVSGAFAALFAAALLAGCSEEGASGSSDAPSAAPTGGYVDAAVIIGLKTLRLKKCQKHAAF